jgi:hypothetical protein
MRLFRFTSVLCAIIFDCYGADPPVHTVCEVLDHLQDFSCRLVRLRARLVSDVDVWLTSDKCKKHVKIGGIQFNDLIALKWPNDPLIGCKVPFVEDRASDEEIRRILSSYETRKAPVYIIVDGIIETRSPPHALVSKAGSRIGFGHLGMAPAQIIVKDVIRIEN